MLGEVLVNLHHRATEVLAIAAHRKFGAGIGDPFGEGFGELLVIPRQEEVAEFVVVDRVGVGRVGDPEVASVTNITSVDQGDDVTARTYIYRLKIIESRYLLQATK